MNTFIYAALMMLIVSTSTAAPFKNTVITCGGDEPFWTMMIDLEKKTTEKAPVLFFFKDIATGVELSAQATQNAPLNDTTVAFFNVDFGAFSQRATIMKSSCTRAMAEGTYEYTVLFGNYKGCCTNNGPAHR